MPAAVEPSDEDLISMYRVGDPRAASILWNRHAPRIYRQAFSRLRCVRRVRIQLAEEIRQETIDTALRTFDPGQAIPFEAYLSVVLRSKVADKSRRERKHPDGAESPGNDHERDDAEILPDQQLSDSRWVELLKVALDRLPADQRTLLERAALGTPPSELGDTPADAEMMRSRLRRLRARLATSMLASGDLNLAEAVYDEIFLLILENAV